MNAVINPARRIALPDLAEKIELSHAHDFGQLDSSSGHRSNTAPQPKISSAGQLYLDCIRCGRALFDNGTGSAGDSTCRLG